MFASVAPAQQTQQASTPVDPDGTLNIPAHKLAPSQFVSEEFRRAYAAHLKDTMTWPVVAPAVDAPKAEWDRYDAATDERIFGPSARYAEQHYPADVVDTTMAGVHVGIVTPKAGIAPENRNRVLINVHGGGFTMGRGLTAGKGESLPVAATARMKVVTIDYRMAPYHTFPAASEDVEAVYRELLKTHKPEQIGIFGCSAGGMLTAQSVAWFQSKGLPRPGAVGIFCAAPQPIWFRGDSSDWDGAGVYRPGAGRMVPDPKALTKSSPATPFSYIGSARPDDPLVTPGVSDAVMAKFPPTLWITGTRSFDMSPVAVSHAQMLRLGVDSYLYVMEGGQHGAYNFGEYMTPEARETVAYIARWFQQHLAR
jgi:acetyl esterase/lipase